MSSSGFDRGTESARNEGTRREENQGRHEQIERGLPYQGHNEDQNKARSISINHPIGDTRWMLL